MRMRGTIKRAVLASLLLLVLLGVSGCFTQPDRIDALPSDPVDVIVPFPTTTVTPSPAPTDALDWNQWAGDPNATGGVGDGAGPTQTLQVITPAPTTTLVTTPTPSPSPTPDSVLRNGSEGQAVRNLQQRLKDLKYYTGSVDGSFGGGTETALKDFQRANGLTADGVAGERTLSALESSSAKAKPSPTVNAIYATSRPTPKSYTPSTPGTYGYLQVGSSGAAVKKLQQRLKDLGYYSGTVSGTYDDATKDAVKAFQERNGEWVDGVAGEDTQQTLYSNNALPIASGSRAVPSSGGYRILQVGDSGDDVENLQARLKELGFYQGSADGSYGDTTKAAVEAFQRTNGIAADGIATAATQLRIFSTLALYASAETAGATQASAAEDGQAAAQALGVDTLEKGATGEDVYRLEERLYDLGYYAGRIDGVYSDAVADSVRAFQRANGLSADGKAGKRTLELLFSDKAKAAEEAADDLYATLRQGDEGERVRALQGLLSTYGYFTEAINGYYGETTVSAVSRMQAQNGLSADGVAGPATQQMLYDGTVQQALSVEAQMQMLAESGPSTTYAEVQSGSTGADVTMMQQFLEELGYDVGTESGTFGPMTRVALQQFQERNGLIADGVAGAETLELLYSGYGVPAVGFGADAEIIEALQAPERDSMREGDEGQDVFTMQERLYALGYLAEGPTGTFGQATTAAVKAFQQRNALEADGIAGQQTVAAMYATGAVPAEAVSERVQAYAQVDNRSRELAEQSGTGAIQASIAGGGVAASYDSDVYYAGKGGTLYRQSSGGSDRQLYDGAASYIHASSKGVTFLSGGRILRVPVRGGNAETLVRGSNIQKLAVVGDTLYYQEGAALMRKVTNMDAVTIMEGINDFTIDIFGYEAYIASDSGIWRVGLNGSGMERIVSSRAEQLQIADSIVFYRSGGNIYRMEDGISVMILDMNATWMAVYRDKLYYISGGALYQCDTDGKNNVMFHEGDVAEVSFVSGKAYLTSRKGGPVTHIVDVSE